MTTDEKWAVKVVLQAYRASRRHHDPYRAARDNMFADARWLADLVVDGADRDVERGKVRFRASRELHKEVMRRAAVGSGRGYEQMTVREQYWQRGRVSS